MKNFKSKIGITLIETLVVVAVLSILMGIMGIAARSAFEKARYSKATLETREIAMAVKAYYAAYGKWPAPNGAPQPSWKAVNKELIDYLCPGGKNFIETIPGNFDSAGYFVDPWKTNAYYIVFDDTPTTVKQENQYQVVITPPMMQKRGL